MKFSCQPGKAEKKLISGRKTSAIGGSVLYGVRGLVVLENIQIYIETRNINFCLTLEEL